MYTNKKCIQLDKRFENLYKEKLNQKIEYFQQNIVFVTGNWMVLSKNAFDWKWNVCFDRKLNFNDKNWKYLADGIDNVCSEI